MALSALRVFSLNARGLRNNRKRRSVFDYLKRNKYEIICIQEAYISDSVADSWKKEWGGELHYSKTTSHSGGLLILFSKHLNCKFDTQVINDRIITANFKIEDEAFAIVNIYAPLGIKERKDFFLSLSNSIKSLKETNIIICGDFNCVLDNDLDIISGEKHANSVVKSFSNLVSDNDLYDSWRMFHPAVKEFSWSRCNPFVARRLDYILTNPNCFNKTIESSLVSVPFSDHRGCYIHLKLTHLTRGPGYWKFPNHLLHDIDYVQEMNKLIESHAEEDPQTSWELLKAKIKSFSTTYSLKKSIEKRNKSVSLQNQLNDLDKMLSRDPKCEQSKNRREKIKLELEILEQTKARAAQVRARVAWIEKGEKNTKYFLHLEKARANAKIMDSLKNEAGQSITNQNEILQTQRNYFANKYQKKVQPDCLTEKMDRFLNGVKVSQISEQQKLDCEGLLSKEEMLDALKQMKGGSSPGCDGITIEFLKMFWNQINPLLLSSFNSAFARGTLSTSQQKAIITLIHKGKELPRNDLKNWRPISLTNSDYKLLAKCLALRLSAVIHNIVDPDQVGYIKGRRVATLLRLIDDVTEQVNLMNKPGLLVAIDFAQAFDSISKEFMLLSFKKFGFGPEFIQWFQILMNNATSAIAYCGWISDYFNMESGLRQGCPFSPLAFVLAIELLAIKIRTDKDIKGIRFGNSNNIDLVNIFKILLYADDVTLLLHDEKDMQLALRIIEQFSEFSGLHINKKKSEAMWLGSTKNNQNSPCNFICKTKLKILGIYFSNDKSASTIEDNWKERIDKIKRVIGVWEKRNLSIMGKICVIKTFLLSQFIYVMQSVVFPDHILTEINRIIYNFLWRKKDCNRKAYEKVKRSIMCKNTELGGLNMIDVKHMQTSFLLQWVMQLCQSGREKWSVIPKHIFNTFGPNLDCFHSNVNSKTFNGLQYITSIFWKSVLTSWLDNNPSSSRPTSLLWNNKFITCSNKPLFFKEWIKAGLYTVADVCENGNIITYQGLCDRIGDSPRRILEYNTVFAAVRSFQRKYQVNTEVELPLFNEKLIFRAQSFRKEVIKLNKDTPTATMFWKNKFNVNIDKYVWNLGKTTTQEIRLRVLHWKILQNIYPTNIMLNKMKVVDSNKCTYCPERIDFIEHFFFSCPSIYPLWRYIEQYCMIQFNISLKLQAEDALLGVKLKNKTLNSKINHIILIAKMAISIFKKTGSAFPVIFIYEQQLALRNREELGKTG